MQADIGELHVESTDAPLAEGAHPSSHNIAVKTDETSEQFSIMSAHSDKWHIGVVRTYSTGSKLYVGGGGCQELVPSDAEYIISAVQSYYYQSTNTLVITAKEEVATSTTRCPFLPMFRNFILVMTQGGFAVTSFSTTTVYKY